MVEEHFKALALQLTQALVGSDISLDAPSDELRAAVQNHPVFKDMGVREFSSVVTTMLRERGKAAEVLRDMRRQ